MIKKFPDFIHGNINDSSMGNSQLSGTVNTMNYTNKSHTFTKQQFADSMTRYLNLEEKRHANQAVEAIINSGFDDSLLVYSQ